MDAKRRWRKRRKRSVAAYTADKHTRTSGKLDEHDEENDSTEKSRRERVGDDGWSNRRQEDEEMSRRETFLENSGTGLAGNCGE